MRKINQPRFPGRGRQLKEITTSTLYYVYYGFDQQGRLRIRRLYQKHSPPSLGILGDPGVNVLRLNLALDRAATQGQPTVASAGP